MTTISLFENGTNAVRDVKQLLDTEFSSLTNHICEHSWGPGQFKKNVRNLVNFEKTDLLVLDVDDGCTIDEARQLLDDEGYEYIIGTSRNHQKDKQLSSGKIKPACDRFRILLPLSRPITTDAEYKATWFEFQKLIPSIDPACKDASRYFFPCTAADYQQGRPYPVYVADVKLPNMSREPQVAKRTNAQAKGKLSERAMNFLFNGAEPWHGERNNFVRECQQNLYTFEEMRELFCKFHVPDATDEFQFKDVWERGVKHSPRINGTKDREALLRVIDDSHYVANIESPDESFFINLDTGAKQIIDIKIVGALLGKERFKDYMSARQIFASFIYDPRKPLLAASEETGITEYNKYVAPGWLMDNFLSAKPLMGVNQVPECYVKFFTHLTDGDSASYEYVLDWLAKSLQGRNLTILTCIGEQGVGKGTLGYIMEQLHGVTNFVKVRDEIFKSKFNGSIANRTLVYVDEIALDDDESMDRLKDVVNNDVEVERKGIDAVSVKNHASFYISSNKMDAIKLEGGDRRFSIIQLTDQKIIENENIKGIVDTLVNKSNIERLALYLMGRQVGDMFSPFRSERFEQVRGAGLTEWEAYVIEDWAPAHVGKSVPLSELQIDIERACDLSKSPGRTKIQRLVRRYAESLRLHRPNHGRPYVITVR